MTTGKYLGVVTESRLLDLVDIQSATVESTAFCFTRSKVGTNCDSVVQYM